jgi:hypothetical protein
MDVPTVEFRDEDLESVRRFMAGDIGGIDVLEGEPEDPAVQAAWSLFIAAFTVAVRRKFGESFTGRSIIEFVAELRISMGKDMDDLDPKVAENWILSALGALSNEEQIRVHKNPEASAFATFAILEALRDENIAGEAGLDAFLQETMNYAKELQKRLPAIWDEVGPLIEAQLPQGGGTAAS